MDQLSNFFFFFFKFLRIHSTNYQCIFLVFIDIQFFGELFSRILKILHILIHTNTDMTN